MIYNIIRRITSIKNKILKKQINIVFVCHRPQVWGALDTLFQACNKDDHFNVTIVSIPNKKELPQLGLSHEIYETEGAEEYFKDFPCTVINGYNYETKKWFNLKKLKPDYIFFQQPYNITRPKQYRSKEIRKYSKLCFIPYFSSIQLEEIELSCLPNDFMKHVYFYFAENNAFCEYYKNYIKQNKLRINTKNFKTVGYPKYDNIEHYRQIKDSNNWHYIRSEKKFRIIWTPRWCTSEGNCGFFEYKDKLLNYTEKNKDVDFIFRPHPQAFLEWNATGELPENEAIIYKNKYKEINNSKIDTKKDYLETFYTSDVLICDPTSLMSEYALTGKPIIYCHKVNSFGQYSKEFAKNFYWVKNWKELEDTINMLKRGEDPKKEERIKAVRDYIYINPNGAGNTIKEIIKEDFYGKN